MKRSKFTEEQIIHALRRAEGGGAVKEIARSLGITEATFYVWKKKYAGLGVPELRKLKSQEEEITRLKRLVADLMLDKQMLQEVIAKSSKACKAKSTWPVSGRALWRQSPPRLQAF